MSNMDNFFKGWRGYLNEQQTTVQDVEDVDTFGGDLETEDIIYGRAPEEERDPNISYIPVPEGHPWLTRPDLLLHKGIKIVPWVTTDTLTPIPDVSDPFGAGISYSPEEKEEFVELTGPSTAKELPDSPWKTSLQTRLDKSLTSDIDEPDVDISAETDVHDIEVDPGTYEPSAYTQTADDDAKEVLAAIMGEEGRLTQYHGGGNVIVRNVDKAWAAPPVQRYLDSLKQQDRKTYVGDIACTEYGGPCKGHKSHRTGVDVDVAYRLADGGHSIGLNDDGTFSFKDVKVEDLDLDDVVYQTIDAEAHGATNAFMDAAFVRAVEAHAKKMAKDGRITNDEQQRVQKIVGVARKGDKEHQGHVHYRFGEPKKHTEQEKYSFGAPEGYSYGYSYGLVGDVDFLDEYDSGKSFYGASMQKPMLALMNLIYSKDPNSGITRLTDDQLKGMLGYEGKGDLDTNKVNAYASKMANSDQVGEFLGNIGLQDSVEDIRRLGSGSGSTNQQTPAGFHKFINILLNYENDPSLTDAQKEYLASNQDSLKTILDYMRRGDRAKDRESRRWHRLKTYLNNNLPPDAKGGPAIRTIWGKGGKYRGSYNYGIVINDRHVLSLYGQHPDDSRDNSRRDRETEKTFNKMVLDILKREQMAADTDAELNVQPTTVAAAPATVDLTAPISGLSPAVMRAFTEAFKTPTDPGTRAWVEEQINYYKNPAWAPEIGEELQRRWDTVSGVQPQQPQTPAPAQTTTQREYAPAKEGYMAGIAKELWDLRGPIEGLPSSYIDGVRMAFEDPSNPESRDYVANLLKTSGVLDPEVVKELQNRWRIAQVANEPGWREELEKSTPKEIIKMFDDPAQDTGWGNYDYDERYTNGRYHVVRETSSRLKPLRETAKRRILQYDPWIKKYSDHFKIDPNIIRGMMGVESTGKKQATSHKGAMGLMQVMPGTFKAMMKDAPSHLKGDAYDPESSIYAGIKYYARMKERAKRDFTEKGIVILSGYQIQDYAMFYYLYGHGGQKNIRERIEKYESTDPTHWVDDYTESGEVGRGTRYIRKVRRYQKDFSTEPLKEALDRMIISLLK